MNVLDVLDPTWRRRAGCRKDGVDPEAFFVIRRGHKGIAMKNEAKAICWHDCPVRAECALTALEIGEIWGIFGGYDMEEVRGWRWNERRKARVLALAEIAARAVSEYTPSEILSRSSG